VSRVELRARSTPTRTAQLELDLNDVRVRIPWSGRSPRGLTRARLAFIFKAQAREKRERSWDSAQLDLFPRAPKKAPWVYQGAPLLSPLRRQ